MVLAQALDRMGKHEASKVQRMAALYGLRSSMQGAGRRRFVMVRGMHLQGRGRCNVAGSGFPQGLA
jgi:hypothetical protein